MITEQEIKDILPSGYKIILDKEYILPSDDDVLSAVKSFIEKRGVFKFKSGARDCDNAAVEMLAGMSGKGWPFALAVLEGHAVCLYINDKKEVKYIEPQTGEPMETKKRLKVTVMT